MIETVFEEDRCVLARVAVRGEQAPAESHVPPWPEPLDPAPAAEPDAAFRRRRVLVVELL